MRQFLKITIITLLILISVFIGIFILIYENTRTKKVLDCTNFNIVKTMDGEFSDAFLIEIGGNFLENNNMDLFKRDSSANEYNYVKNIKNLDCASISKKFDILKVTECYENKIFILKSLKNSSSSIYITVGNKSYNDFSTDMKQNINSILHCVKAKGVIISTIWVNSSGYTYEKVDNIVIPKTYADNYPRDLSISYNSKTDLYSFYDYYDYEENLKQKKTP